MYVREVRLLVALFLMTVVVAPVPTGHAHAQPRGAPQTLAKQHAVLNDEQVASDFPIDFIGVFYEGDAEGGTVRVRRDGRWGPWVELHDDGVEVEGRWASGLVPASDADAYQVRVPRDARKPKSVAINTTDGPSQASSAVVVGCADTTAVVSRCEWGADESLMTWTPEFYPAQKLTIHHTATANGDADPAATVRAIYRYQAVDRAFGDIGYQYLIDESGRVYEGRYSGTDSSPGHDASGSVVTAAHVGGFNSGNTGIALLGTLTSVGPTVSARGALEQLLRNLTVSDKIDPRGTSVYVNPVTAVTKFVANISGHRDWAATECPGGVLYAMLPTIRDAVAGTSSADAIPPVISSVSVLTTSTSATVRWLTDEASSSLVEYRRSGSSSFTSSGVDTSLLVSHERSIPGLSRRTVYEYRVTSADTAGNTSTSAILTFKTAK